MGIPRFWRRQRQEDEMAAELRFHVESRAADLQRSGMDPAASLRSSALRSATRKNAGLRWAIAFSTSSAAMPATRCAECCGSRCSR
jgi:hypothetical protein